MSAPTTTPTTTTTTTATNDNDLTETDYDEHYEFFSGTFVVTIVTNVFPSFFITLPS